jgi:pimeloyl-ACP methyl ester carboxylesterase
MASARRCRSQARDRGNRGIDGVPLVERRVGRTKSSRDCTDGFHDPQDIRHGYCGCAAALARLDYGSRLNEINAPALVICGSEDHGAPSANSRQMQAMIKDARFLEIKQAGHISNIEQPIIFNAAVRNFLDDVESRQALSP